LSVFAVLILFSSALCRAQSAKELANAYMLKYLDYKIDPELTRQLSLKPGDNVIEAFEPYLSDSLPRARNAACQMIAKTGSASVDLKIRRLAVKILVSRLNDNDGGVAGPVINYLQDFSPDDFDAEQRYNISMKVKQQPAPLYLNKLILLTGYLGIDELIYNYKSMLADTNLYSPGDKWNIKLAMARMGDAEALNEVTARISRLKVTDDVVYEIYPNLAYVRQKEAFEILFDEILSDEKNCNSSNPDSEVDIICAFRIIGYTAKYVKDFPVKTDAFGEPIMDNYDAVLISVREWIIANRENYSFINDLY
jgi:hypothetical protein